jgi:hypothetical protein
MLALFLGKSKAVTDHSNGLGGEAPCLQSYSGVWESEEVGWDPHAVHGIQAADGGYVAVGMALEEEEGSESHDSFVVKTKGDCIPDETYSVLDGSGCNALDWTTRFGTEGKTDMAMWVAESPDGTYMIVTGISEASDGLPKMNIVKIDESDGSIMWEMSYGTGSGVESVAFTSDGGFVVSGFLDTEEPANEMGFKSGGQAEGTPFVGKISAEDAAGSTKPTSFEWTYTKEGESFRGSAKAMRIDSDDNIFLIMGLSIVVKLDSSGEEEWNTGSFEAIQFNDLELASDGLVAVGHKYT